MPLTLRDKVGLYENFLRSISSTEWDVDVNTVSFSASESREYKYAYCLGVARARLRRCVEEAQYALAQGKK